MERRNNFFLPLIVGFIATQIISDGNLVFAEEPSLQQLAAQQAFLFEQYPAAQIEANFSKKPILSTKLARRYKAAITLAMKEPKNFSGHYRVVTWGCGTDCRGFAIINKLSGVAYTLPGLEYVSGVMGNEEDRLNFRVDSRLFVITGLLNDSEEGKFYYLWEKEKLKLLMKLPVQKQSYSE